MRIRYHARMTRTARLFAVAALTFLATSAGAQTLETGSLLVASPGLDDPNFAQSVVLVLRHDANGTIGVVVNRVTSLTPASVFGELEDLLATYDGRLYRGGPLAPTQLLFLVQGLAAAVVDGPTIVDNIFVSGNPQLLPELVALAEGERGLRLYAGHAEWVEDQLSSEIEAGSWLLVPGTAELVFHEDPTRVWRAALALTAEAVAASPR